MKKLVFENFQGHTKSVIRPAKGVTAITGRSDHGKSSIIRGIRWVHQNKPSGTAFIHKGEKNTTVSIDGVRHERTKTENKYYVEGHKKPFKALRGAVPEEVLEALNLGNENIQAQFDKPFLLEESAGKVAQKLSTLVDLEAPTRALAFLASKKRQHKEKVSAIKQSIETTELQIEKLNSVPQADTDLALLESKLASIEQLKQKRATLFNAYESARSASSELADIPSIDALAPAKKLLASMEEFGALSAEHEMLSKTKNEIEKLNAILAFDPTSLLKRAKRLLALMNKREILVCSWVRAGSGKALVEKLKTQEIEAKEKKDEVLAGTCPLCGRE